MPVNETIKLKRGHIATGVAVAVEEVGVAIQLFVNELLDKHLDFTGKLEINFKNGKLMDINETKRTKF